jgi:hypothetical protein
VREVITMAKAMGPGRARLTNGLLASQVSRPVTVPSPANRPAVTVHVEFDDGQSGDLPGLALGWSEAAVVVRFEGFDGSPWEEWFPAALVQRA